MNAEVEQLELVLGLHSRSGSSQAKYQAKYLELVGDLSSLLDVLLRRETPRARGILLRGEWTVRLLARVDG